MKKTLATLLVLAMVVSACSMLFVSAGDPYADLKAELEALVGAKADAPYSWDIDVSVDEAGVVTADVTLDGVDDLGVICVEGYLYYDAEKLTILNGFVGDALDCVTALPGDASDWENLSVLAGDGANPGAVMLSVITFDTEMAPISSANPVVFTLKFQLAEGEMAGIYVPTSEDCYVASFDFTPIYGNGAYAIAYVEPPHTHAYAPADITEPTLSTEGVLTYTCECGDSYTEAIPAVKAQPETLVDLPEGALLLDYAGYIHDSYFCIVAGDNLTVNELTALGNDGAGKDMNYVYVIVVDANGVVTETWFTLGRPDGVKSDVVCPEGGYIIGFNGNKAGADALTKIEKGAKVTLYNIDLEAIRGVAGHATVTNAGFTYENPAPVENTKQDINVNDNAILTDGKTGFTGAWGEVGTGDVLLITNGNCQNAGMDVTLSYALGEAKKIDGITVDLYHCAGVMIGYPEGQATVEVSVDGTTWTKVGKYDLAAAEVAVGASGTVSNVFSFDAVEAAYVRVLLYAGSSTPVLGDTPADNKIFWEFIAVAEVAVSEAPKAPEVIIYETPEEIVNAAYALENGAVLSDGHLYTLTGEIIGIQTAYSEQYKNVSVVIAVAGLEDKPILCFRLKGEGADLIKIGDTITVTGAIKNYNGTIEFDAGCTLDSYVPGEPEVIIYETPEEIVNAAYELDKGATLSAGHLYELTGVIVSIDTEYSEQYGNITVTIQVGDMTDKLIKCYRLKGEGAADLKVGDTITVKGAIKNYNGTVEFDAGCTLESVVPAPVIENTKQEVNVNDNAILTDGKTGFTGNWGEVGTGDVVLVTNGNCQNAGMDVTLSYALGEAKKIDGITVDLYHCAGVMIGYPEGQATVLVSVDGETWTEVGKYDLAAAEVAVGSYGTVSNVFSFDAVEAAYVKVELYAGSSTSVLGDTPADNKVFWEFISVAEVAVSEAVEVEPDDPSEPDEPSEPEQPKNWEDTLVKGENGNYTVEYPYGYTWGVNYVDGTIAGEDVTIITSLEAYNNSNPKWAITVILEKQEDGSYLAVQDAITGDGNIPAITLGENQIAMVVHSSASNPDNEAYFNWTGKVVAMSVKAGDKFNVDLDAMTVTAVDPAAVETPEDSEPSGTPGDAGILIFAILGVLAIAGAAVVIKVRH